MTRSLARFAAAMVILVALLVAVTAGLAAVLVYSISVGVVDVMTVFWALVGVAAIAVFSAVRWIRDPDDLVERLEPHVTGGTGGER